MIETCCICGGKTKRKCDVYYGEFMAIRESGTRSIGICPDCGYIYIMNPLSLETTNDYYNTNAGVADTSSSADARIAQGLKRMHFIFDTIGATGSIQTVFEIGSVGGMNLSLYKEKGMDVCGTELSLRNIEYARSRYGIELYQTDLDGYSPGSEEKYDLVYMSHVLEHIPDPHSAMKKVSSISGKYVFIEVPSFDFNYFGMPYGIFIPTHHSYFTLESLKNLMKAVGYKLLDSSLLLGGGNRPSTLSPPSIRTLWEKYDDAEKAVGAQIYKSVISSERHLDMYIEQSENLIKEISVIIDRIPDNLRLAVWPVSRSTALLYNRTNLSKKNIVKFYANSEIFHTRKIEGRDVSLFSKADVIANDIEAILVTSYEHTPAIYNTIVSSGADCDIIALYE